MTTTVQELSDWVETLTDEMFSWAFYKVSDAEVAKDLVQDTFLAVAEKLDNFQGKSSPKTWLFSILNNKIIDFYRKKVKKPENIDNQIISKIFDQNGGWKNDKLPSDWHEEEGHLLDNDEFNIVLNECLEKLPEKWNTCIKLKYITGKKGDDVCQELDIASTNYWQIVHRAKLQLRDCIEENWFHNQ